MANNCKQLMKGALDGALNEFRGISAATAISAPVVIDAASEDISNTNTPKDLDINQIDRNNVDYSLQPNDNPSSISKKFNIPQDEVSQSAVNSNSTWNVGDVLQGLQPRGYPVKGVNEMPEFVKSQEAGGMEHKILRPHKPTPESGLTLGYGYDKTGRTNEDILSDFKEAGIGKHKAEAFIKGKKNFKITPEQSTKLSNIAWRQKYETGIQIGIPLDTMEDYDRDRVMSLLYRGDIVKGENSYRGRLYDLAKNNRVDLIDKFIRTNNVPRALKNRWDKV